MIRSSKASWRQVSKTSSDCAIVLSLVADRQNEIPEGVLATYNLESVNVVLACSHLEQILREISDRLVQLVDINAIVAIRRPRLRALACASPVVFYHDLFACLCMNVRPCANLQCFALAGARTMQIMDKLLII